MDIVIVVAAIIAGYLIVRQMSRFGREGPSEGQAKYARLSNATDLDTLFASSSDQPRIVLLHDPWCPVSARASRQLAQVDADIVMIDVSRQHELSRQMEQRTGIRHESPQAMLIDNGEAVWHESHMGIDRKSIDRALEMWHAKREREQSRL
ncbi:MAG: monothiol bacilliredoxin BrxC family protein [Thermomicrobiales bacterium]